MLKSKLGYLGHVISNQGVATDPTKTEAMIKWPVPSTVTELRGFLGLTGYYRKFIKHYGLIAQAAFDQLKQAMVTTLVLAIPNFNQPFIVETDASYSGVGAVLTQGDQPVAFMTKALGPTHQKLSIYEKEFLSLIMAVEKWRQYLQRQEFLIMTDHKSMSNLSEQNLHSEMQIKAMTRLMGLQFKVIYRKLLMYYQDVTIY